MALIKTVDQRFPGSGQTGISINTGILARFSAFYEGGGPVHDMDVLSGFASLSANGNTSWINLPVLGSSLAPPECATPALTLLPGTVYTWTAQAYMYINQPGHGAPFNTTVISSEYTFTTAGSPPSPYKVENPGPEDDATNINRITDLTWDEGANAADDYDVWFGTPGNMVLVGTEITAESFSIQDYINEGVDPEDPTVYLDLDTEYEWRIDSYVNNILVATGDVWSYTTRAQRTVVLSLPANTGIDVLLQPLLEWTIDGIGAQYGSFEDQDFLFIYFRKDDANFTEDDLIGNFVQAFANDDLQVVAGLAYNNTYYWQVQAGNTAADLADSEVWSFTTQVFSPPVPSTDPISGLPTGENAMLDVRRLVAIANNKFWYEDI